MHFENQIFLVVCAIFRTSLNVSENARNRQRIFFTKCQRHLSQHILHQHFQIFILYSFIEILYVFFLIIVIVHSVTVLLYLVFLYSLCFVCLCLSHELSIDSGWMSSVHWSLSLYLYSTPCFSLNLCWVLWFALLSVSITWLEITRVSTRNVVHTPQRPEKS